MTTSENQSADFHFDLAGRVKNLGFSPSPLNALFPVFEAIANSLHAIEERFGREAASKGQIEVTIHRDSDSKDENPPVRGFTVKDNGAGLNAANWRAFRTADTPSKIQKNGKGVGRLSWLKVFSKTQVFSAYEENGAILKRSFDFFLSPGNSNPLANHEHGPAGAHPSVFTTIRLEPFAADYVAHCPRKTETIAAHIIGHFLRNFASYEVPRFTLVDRHENIQLLDFYSENVETEQQETLRVEIPSSPDPVELEIYHIVLNKGLKLHDGGRHWCLYVGDGRVVEDERIDNQLGLNYIGKGRDCVYLCLVSGSYLNSHVNQERTKFTFLSDDLKAIHAKTINAAKVYLEPYISEVRTKQAETTLLVIRENPQFLSVVSDVRQFVDSSLSLNSKTEEEIYLELARQRRRKQRETKREIKALTTTSGEDVSERVTAVADAINADKKGSLAEYVVKRKEILDLLDSSISYADPEKRNYLKEEMVHNLIIPIRSDGDDLTYEDHNLWILDDRLAFYSFLKSDKPFNTFLTDSESGRESDITVVFDRSLAFDRSGTDEPIIIVEFKRPGRKDYSPADNPITQVLEYVRIMRQGGSFKDKSGKHRKPIPTSTRFICYVVADFTDKLIEMVSMSIAQHKSADGEGYFGFSPIHNAFVEVLPYNKLLHDARIRNEAFFDKLGLS